MSIESFIEGTWGSVEAGDVVIAADGKRYHVLAADWSLTAGKLRRAVTIKLADDPSAKPIDSEPKSPKSSDPVMIQDRLTPVAENAGVEVDAVALAAIVSAFPESFSMHSCDICAAFVLPSLQPAHLLWHEEMCS